MTRLRGFATAALLVALALSCVHALPVPHAVREVAYGPDPLQRYDLHLPAQVDRRTPLVVYVHGGGWRHGDEAAPGTIGPKRDRWVAAGAAFVSVDYRLLPAADPLTQAGDVARALAAVQRHAARLGADPSNLVLMGHSAGAHLVALVTVSPSLRQGAGVRPWAGTVLLDSAAVDVPALMGAPHPVLYDRAFGNDPTYWQAASPLQQATARTAPVLAVCASGRNHSCGQNRRLLERLARHGTRTRLLPEPLDHRQINRLLGEDNAYTHAVEAFMRSVGLRL